MTHEFKDATFTVADGIAWFHMNRPDLLNALTDELRVDFSAMLDVIDADPSIRVLVLSGEGRAFSAGGNVKGMASREASSPAGFRDRVRTLHIWLKRLVDLRCPVIAKVDGLAFGGGFALALTADLVFASSAARFSAVFGRIGLIPDMALIYTLPRLVGRQRAKELMLTARSIDAEEAKALGIVLEVCEPDALDARVDSFAKGLTAGSTEAMALTKQLVNRAHDSDYDTMAELEANGQAMMVATDFHREAVRRFAAKETPLFNWDTMTNDD
jgi:2-(1,2-epoxy-1,2-dihydrophenyl)acetyl-CoA isomerase